MHRCGSHAAGRSCRLRSQPRQPVAFGRAGSLSVRAESDEDHPLLRRLADLGLRVPRDRAAMRSTTAGRACCRRPRRRRSRHRGGPERPHHCLRRPSRRRRPQRRTLLPTLLDTHAPLDLVIIMLGSNDMKPWIHGHSVGRQAGDGPADRDRARPSLSARRRRAAGADRVAAAARRDRRMSSSRRCSAGGIEASQKLAPHFSAAGRRGRLRLLRRRHGRRTTPLDGVHLDAENTRAIGAALAPVARMMLAI